MGNLQLQCQADNQKLVNGNMSICLSLLEIRMQLKVAVASKRALWKGERLSCSLETCLLMRLLSSLVSRAVNKGRCPWALLSCSGDPQ